jgi:hypothetical protein
VVIDPRVARAGSWRCAGRWACALPLLALCAAPGPARASASGGVLTVKPRSEAAKDAPRAASAPVAPVKTLPGDETRPISIGVVGGYSPIIDDAATEGVNPFGVGFGISGGYAIGPLYIGTRFLFFLGQTRSRPDDETERSADEFLVGLEGGYTVGRLGPLALRPELGLGFAFSNSESVRDVPVPEPVDTSSTDPYVDIGVVLELSVSRELFFGLQARAVYVPFKESARGDHELIGVPLLASCGMRF